ncbi:hypothetical protein NPIL_241321 [Nephila pilipes]|uniref:Uncharacterized protein n=1 Tax=Nephila pilipes TaxID=299642 RepID=A0A8X6PGR4_NEPPI|nr:hypothetical protein NPIL_241321 [Nephila pilipes]
MDCCITNLMATNDPALIVFSLFPNLLASEWSRGSIVSSGFFAGRDLRNREKEDPAGWILKRSFEASILPVSPFGKLTESKRERSLQGSIGLTGSYPGPMSNPAIESKILVTLKYWGLDLKFKDDRNSLEHFNVRLLVH